ncbi:MAG: pilus assembly PilX N-terminal domain-containing protein [Planctomycetes bacterium]|nr:pilus assembly PilX N-terminal domain-containing protein [Planctomycetota bacterium]
MTDRERTDAQPPAPAPRARRRGSALTLTLVVGMLLIAVAAASVSTVTNEVTTARADREAFLARIAAQSGINDALAQLKLSLTPSTAQWSRLGDGGFYYRSVSTGATVHITCWGRIRNDERAQQQLSIAPDDPAYDARGWTIHAMEALVHRTKHFPNAPIYVGNGGVEKGRGGFAWSGTADPNDPSTWTYLPTNNDSSIDSYMARQLQLRVDARDHAIGFLNGQGFPSGDPNEGQLRRPAGTPHPYSLFASQNLVGQHNAQAFFQPWTQSGTTYDPRTVQQPSLTNTSIYPDPKDAFQLDNQLPDVQEFAWALWAAYNGQAGTVTIPANNQNLGVTGGAGTVVEVGTIDDPKVAFVTGNLFVGSNRTLKGAGILVIRDDYHPTLGPFNNTPSGATKEAQMRIDGSLEWTGLVIIAGWRPTVSTSNMSAGHQVRINGAFFGEDSVQSGGEVSLDAAQIQFHLGPSKSSNSDLGHVEISYCRSIFEPGGFVYNLMPELRRDVVYIRSLR